MSRRTIPFAVVVLASCAAPAPRDRSEGDGFVARPPATVTAPSASGDASGGDGSASANEPVVEEPAPSASVIAIVTPPPSASAPPSAAPSPTAGPATVTTVPAEKLKLVGLLTGEIPKALCTAPDGLAWVLRVGDLVPRSAGGVYRVDFISDADMQFAQVDPPAGKAAERLTLTLR